MQGALPAIDLTAQTCLTSAIANDIGEDWVFAQQVYGYGHPDDVLLGISTSGRSTNILRAMDIAKRRGMGIIGLTGPYVHEFAPLCDVVISCPGANTAEIQEGHMRIYHELCKRLEEEFYT